MGDVGTKLRPLQPNEEMIYLGRKPTGRTKLFVIGLPQTATEEWLYELFGLYGGIYRADIVTTTVETNPFELEPSGTALVLDDDGKPIPGMASIRYGFVTFWSELEARQAQRALNGLRYSNTEPPLRVRFAKPKTLSATPPKEGDEKASSTGLSKIAQDYMPLRAMVNAANHYLTPYGWSVRIVSCKPTKPVPSLITFFPPPPKAGIYLPGQFTLQRGFLPTRALSLQHLNGFEYAVSPEEHETITWPSRHDVPWLPPASPTLVTNQGTSRSLMQVTNNVGSLPPQNIFDPNADDPSASVRFARAACRRWASDPIFSPSGGWTTKVEPAGTDDTSEVSVPTAVDSLRLSYQQRPVGTPLMAFDARRFAPEHWSRITSSESTDISARLHAQRVRLNATALVSDFSSGRRKVFKPPLKSVFCDRLGASFETEEDGLSPENHAQPTCDRIKLGEPHPRSERAHEASASKRVCFGQTERSQNADSSFPDDDDDGDAWTPTEELESRDNNHGAFLGGETVWNTGNYNPVRSGILTAFMPSQYIQGDLHESIRFIDELSRVRTSVAAAQESLDEVRMGVAEPNESATVRRGDVEAMISHISDKLHRLRSYPSPSQLQSPLREIRESLPFDLRYQATAHGWRRPVFRRVFATQSACQPSRKKLELYSVQCAAWKQECSRLAAGYRQALTLAKEMGRPLPRPLKIPPAPVKPPTGVELEHPPTIPFSKLRCGYTCEIELIIHGPKLGERIASLTTRSRVLSQPHQDAQLLDECEDELIHNSEQLSIDEAIRRHEARKCSSDEDLIIRTSATCYPETPAEAQNGKAARKRAYTFALMKAFAQVGLYRRLCEDKSVERHIYGAAAAAKSKGNEERVVRFLSVPCQVPLLNEDDEWGF